MYSIKKTEYGFRLRFGGSIEADEMEMWKEELRSALRSIRKGFAVFVDMRTLEPLSDEAQIPMNEGQRLALEAGMSRSVVILKDNITTLQFIRIARQSGIYETERYISAVENPAWEEMGLAWILDGKEPGE